MSTPSQYLVAFRVGKFGKEQRWLRYGPDADQVQRLAERAMAEEWPDKKATILYVSRVIEAPDGVLDQFMAL